MHVPCSQTLHATTVSDQSIKESKWELHKSIMCSEANPFMTTVTLVMFIWDDLMTRYPQQMCHNPVWTPKPASGRFTNVTVVPFWTGHFSTHDKGALHQMNDPETINFSRWKHFTVEYPVKHSLGQDACSFCHCRRINSENHRAQSC